ncbi:hypothetical protein HMPREF1074_03402 [Bacteroides xylanisolvens CL03T12C04]|jgi:hypothetical protein|uniref:Uncharacterized protein n=1 Tax=Bacteroides xylanisolvens CL03T12C04 TaxID=997892 RepID=I9UQY3_9BACE|nr:hypothetical protein HMPREF1074_03402 [Bacteroides xylanisolvens CL03T12C04]
MNDLSFQYTYTDFNKNINFHKEKHTKLPLLINQKQSHSFI